MKISLGSGSPQSPPFRGDATACNYFLLDFETSRGSLNSSSFSKLAIEPLMLRCGWTLRWKDIRIVVLYASSIFFFISLKMNKAGDLTVQKVCLLLRSTYSPFHKSCTRFASVLFSVFYFPELVSDKISELMQFFFVYFVHFVIRFIFITKLLYLRMCNVNHHSTSQISVSI